jgi:hypothetical protein
MVYKEFRICAPCHIFLDYKIWEDEIGGARGTQRRVISAIFFIEKLKKKTSQ